MESLFYFKMNLIFKFNSVLISNTINIDILQPTYTKALQSSSVILKSIEDSETKEFENCLKEINSLSSQKNTIDSFSRNELAIQIFPGHPSVSGLPDMVYFWMPESSLFSQRNITFLEDRLSCVRQNVSCRTTLTMYTLVYFSQ